MQAPDKVTEIEIEFEKGNPVAIDGVKMSPATILSKLNQLGGANGIGRLDLVESRFVGMKSRGKYITQPAKLEGKSLEINVFLYTKYSSMIFILEPTTVQVFMRLQVELFCYMLIEQWSQSLWIEERCI